MLLVLKIPVVYLAAVVWWAIRAEPHPGEGPDPVHARVPLEPCDWPGRIHRRALARGVRGPRPTRRRPPRVSVGGPS